MRYLSLNIFVSLLLIICLLYVAFVFPPVNWPDEHRNLRLLERGVYGAVYGPIQHTIRDLLSDTGLNVGRFDRASHEVAQSAKWHMMKGSLRYVTTKEYVSSSYYLAKLINVLIICMFLSCTYLILRFFLGRKSVGHRYNLIIASMLAPSVCYQLMQVSTDLLFILFSIVFFIVEEKKKRIAFGFVCLFMALIEDRSFAILSAVSWTTALSSGIFGSRFFIDSKYKRFLFFVVGSAFAILVGNVLGKILRDSAISIALHGFDNLQSQLNYTATKSFNPLKSPGVLYAGLVYLPGATEFFVYSIPLFIVASISFFRLGKIVLLGKNECARNFFFLSWSILVVFFVVTNTTHVFEAGRYYYTFIPMLIISTLSGRKINPDPNLTGAQILKVTGFFVFINILITTLISFPTLISK